MRWKHTLLRPYQGDRLVSKLLECVDKYNHADDLRVEHIVDKYAGMHNLYQLQDAIDDRKGKIALPDNRWHNSVEYARLAEEHRVLSLALEIIKELDLE